MLKILLFILIFLNLLLANDEYIFWANVSNKNYILYHEDQVVSPVMRPSKDPKTFLACELKYKDIRALYPDASLDLPPKDKAAKYAFFRIIKDELYLCFTGSKVLINAKDKVNNLNSSSLTNVRMAPLRFIAQFGLDSVLLFKVISKD